MNEPDDEYVSAKAVYDLYAAFEEVVEGLLPHVSRLLINYNDGELRITSNSKVAPEFANTASKITSRFADGYYYFTITARGEEI